MYFIHKQNFIISTLFILLSNFSSAADLDLNYKNQTSQYSVQQRTVQQRTVQQRTVQQKTQYLNSDPDRKNAFTNMGADGRRNMLESDARNRKQAEQKGNGSGKGKGRGKGKHSQEL
jgi:hypothetical protein